MNRPLFQIFFLSLSWFNLINGQTCNLSLEGTITDLHDRSPIIGALVKLEGTNYFSQTDFDGNYQLEGLCPGKYQIIILHPECPTVKKRINIQTSQVNNFDLEHHINELEEIILSEKRISKLRKSVQEVSLDIGDINSYGSNTMVEALSYISGASVLKTGNGIAKPAIHGMYGSRVGIVTDDFRQHDQEWGPDHAPNIDFNSFETIQLIKGAAALKYGGDTSGGLIILSSSRKQLKDSLYGNSNLILESNGKGGKITSMLEKTYSNGFFLNGQFTAKRFGDFHAPRYLLSNTGLREADFSIKLGKDKIVSGWKFGYSSYAVETGILKGAHIGNVEDLFYALNSDEPRVIEDFSYQIGAPKQQGKHQKISFSYFNLFKNQSKFEWGYNFQVNDRKEFDVRRGGRTEIPAIDLVLKTHNIIGSLSGINIENWTFELGINGLLQDNFSDPNTGIKRLIPDYLKYEAGAYVLGNFQKSNFFIWEWGMRLDQIVIDAKKYYDLSVWSERNYSVVFSDFEMQKTGSQILTNPKLFFLNFSAQTGISSKIGDRFKINASYVLSQRAPNASELFSDGLHHSIAAIEYGSLSLQKEISHKLLFSISKEKGSIIWSFEPFISKVYDYIYIEPTRLEQTIRGAFPVWEYNATDVFLTGIDFTSSLSINREFKFDLGASYTYAQDLQNKNPLILIPPLNSYQKLKYTPREGKWDFEIVHHLNARQKRFPNSNFQVNLIQEGQLVSQTVDISTPPPGFQRLDLYFSYNLKNKSSLKSQIRIIAQNLTNSEYRDYLNRMRFYSADLGRNLQVQLNFKY